MHKANAEAFLVAQRDHLAALKEAHRLQAAVREEEERREKQQQRQWDEKWRQ